MIYIKNVQCFLFSWKCYWLSYWVKPLRIIDSNLPFLVENLKNRSIEVINDRAKNIKVFKMVFFHSKIIDMFTTRQKVDRYLNHKMMNLSNIKMTKCGQTYFHFDCLYIGIFFKVILVQLVVMLTDRFSTFGFQYILTQGESA